MQHTAQNATLNQGKDTIAAAVYITVQNTLYFEHYSTKTLCTLHITVHIRRCTQGLQGVCALHIHSYVQCAQCLVDLHSLAMYNHCTV